MTSPDTVQAYAAPPRSGTEAELLNAAESAQLLGIAEAHFYNLKKLGKLGPRPVKLGRSVRYLRLELLAWAAAGSPDQRHWESVRNYWLSKSQVFAFRP